MTEHEMQLQVIRDIGQLLAEVTGLKASFDSAQEMHASRHFTVVARLDKIEVRLDGHDAEAMRTGSYKVATLQAKLDEGTKDARMKSWETIKIVGAAMLGIATMYVAMRMGLR